MTETEPTRVFTPDLTASDYIATIETLPYPIFSQLPDHPIQRDTALHAVRLLGSGVLDPPLEQHREVSVILVGDPARDVTIAGMREQFAADCHRALATWGHKGNGHSRDHLARTGHWTAPPTVRATIYAAADPKAAAQIYQAIDSIDAAKVATDQLQSTLRIARITPRSEFVQRCSGLSRALDLAIGVLCGSLRYARPRYLAQAGDHMIPEAMLEYYTLLPYLNAVETFKSAIEIIDELKLSAKALPLKPPYLAAYLSILQRDPEAGVPFIEAVKNGSGIQSNERIDPVFVVHALPPYFAAAQRSRNLKAKQRATQMLCGVLNAYEGWGKGEDFQVSKPPLRDTVIAHFNAVLRDRLERADAPSSISASRPRIRPQSEGGAAVALPTLMAPG
jgi:hypothetical protein